MTDKEYLEYVEKILNSMASYEREMYKKAISMGTIDFMGFFHIYDHLSKIVPKNYTVIDFGCAYNFQSYFFRDFKRYMAVEPPFHDDLFGFECFRTDNCEVYRMTTKEFLNMVDYPKKDVFVICSYVPNWHGQDSIALVHDRFRNCFTFYP